MTWQTIAASETDANSPLNQTLMDKIRGNLDHLHSAGAQLMFVNGLYDNPGSPTEHASGDITINSEIDWRDRYVKIVGVVHMGQLVDYAKVVPGGANDDQIGDEYAAAISSMWPVHFNGWFYSSAGGTSRTDDPEITASYAPSWYVNLYLWVDANDGGKLKLGFATDGSNGNRNFAYNLIILYSEDQGGH